MKCKNCGSLIPDQSTFCPYCGISSAEIQDQPLVSQPAVSYAAQNQQPTPISAKIKRKVQTCPQCGALLGKKEKICSICGAAIPKPKKPRNAKAAIISMSIVICLLLCSTVYFMLEMFQSKSTENKLTIEVTSLHNLLDFYEQHVAVIDADRYHYHAYGCPELELPFYTYIYSKKTAEDRGYFPCPYCQ